MKKNSIIFIMLAFLGNHVYAQKFVNTIPNNFHDDKRNIKDSVNLSSTSIQSIPNTIFRPRTNINQTSTFSLSGPQTLSGAILQPHQGGRADCPALTPFSWQALVNSDIVYCSSNINVGTHGSNISVTNTDSTKIGKATLTCDNGNWKILTSECKPIQDSACNVQMMNKSNMNVIPTSINNPSPNSSVTISGSFTATILDTKPVNVTPIPPKQTRLYKNSMPSNGEGFRVAMCTPPKNTNSNADPNNEMENTYNKTIGNQESNPSKLLLYGYRSWLNTDGNYGATDPTFNYEYKHAICKEAAKVITNIDWYNCSTVQNNYLSITDSGQFTFSCTVIFGDCGQAINTKPNANP